MATLFPQTLGAYVDPDDERIKAMEAALMQARAPMFTPEQIAQRRAANARQHDLGLLGSLSGDEQAGQVGGQVFKQALAARQPRITERGTADQITGEFTYDPQFLEQRDRAALEGLQTKRAGREASYNAARIAATERKDLEAQRAEDRAALRAATGAAGSGANDARIWRAEDSLRGDYDKLTKDLREEVNATSKIQQIVTANAGRRPDAITQQSLVILLNKFLDPGSVVREGEFDRVVKAQGLEGRAKNLADYILRGEPLNPAAIAQINGLATLYQQAATSKMKAYGQDYTEIAKRRGLDAGAVISDPRYRPDVAPPGGGAPTVIDVGAALKAKPQALPKANPPRLVEGTW